MARTPGIIEPLDGVERDCRVRNRKANVCIRVEDCDVPATVSPRSSSGTEIEEIMAYSELMNAITTSFKGLSVSD